MSTSPQGDETIALGSGRRCGKVAPNPSGGFFASYSSGGSKVIFCKSASGIFPESVHSLCAASEKKAGSPLLNSSSEGSGGKYVEGTNFPKRPSNQTAASAFPPATSTPARS